MELPQSVGEIGPYAFVRCYSLDSVRMPSSNSNVHETAFTGDSDVHFIWPDDWAKKQIDKLRIVAPALGGLIEINPFSIPAPGTENGKAGADKGTEVSGEY